MNLVGADIKVEGADHGFDVFRAQFGNVAGLGRAAVTGAIIATVVPETLFSLKTLCGRYFNCDPLVVGDPGVDIGVSVLVDYPEDVGADRLVNAASARGTGQLPDKEHQLYVAERDELYLIPPAEVPVTNISRDEILAGDALPIYHAAYTPCFRREAGAAGKDTRGLIRVHQFDKVELVRFSTPECSAAEHEILLGHAEAVLQRLELPYRVVLLAAGDTGFSSAKTYDLEVWAAGVGAWLEASSASCFTDFQARRANIRYRKSPDAKPHLLHTLNASGVALPRTLIALLENNQQPDGSVRLPAALVPYFGADRLPVP